MHLSRIVVVCCLTFTALIPGRVETRGAADPFVVFGTSLSDSGNAFALAGGTNTPPDFSVDALLVPARRGRPRSARSCSEPASWPRPTQSP